MITILNEQIFTFLHSFAHRAPALDAAIVFIANEFAILAGFAAIVFLVGHVHRTHRLMRFFSGWKENLFEGVLVVLSVVAVWAAALALKLAFATPRPFLADPTLQPLFIHGGTDSFPSGHAAFMAAVGFALFMRHRIAGAWFVLAALVIGAARVSAGVHYPIDIVAGFILAGIGVYLVSILPMRLFKTISMRLRFKDK